MGCRPGHYKGHLHGKDYRIFVAYFDFLAPILPILMIDFSPVGVCPKGIDFGYANEISPNASSIALDLFRCFIRCEVNLLLGPQPKRIIEDDQKDIYSQSTPKTKREEVK